jgi:predicted RNA binding protein YcfA (HicA-like mRNA interferase family)
MPKTPVLSGEEMIRVLEKIGFRRVRQVGDHVSLERTEANATEASGYKRLKTVVPLHAELKPGTLKGIMRQAELSDNDLTIIMKW